MTLTRAKKMLLLFSRNSIVVAIGDDFHWEISGKHITCPALRKAE
jgi:hypothetical protein